MKVNEEEIKQLQEWLGPRLGALIAHSDRVRTLLGAGDAPKKIIQSAVEMVLGMPPAASPSLSPMQIELWQRLLPIVSEHGLLALKTGGLALAEDVPMTKKEAAEFLGLKVRKLELCMKKKQVEYQKYGAGKSASVRFLRSELEKFQASRKVAAKRGCA